MTRKIAIKKLTASDLTLFAWHYKNRYAGNQKAINLNANVLVDVFYPSLPEAAPSRDGRLPLDVHIFGPGLANDFNIQRKIIKNTAYKNWRLNGEYIENPIDHPDRFNCLSPGDFVILEFSGDVLPHSVFMYFISKSLEVDKALFEELTSWLGENKMSSIPVGELFSLVNRASPDERHPVYRLVIDNELEDTVLGGAIGTTRLLSRAPTRNISPETLVKARQAAETTGKLGEVFVNAWFSRLRDENEISEFVWVSSTLILSPYDFQVTLKTGETIFLDVKSTAGPFENIIHISFSELYVISRGSHRYDIYRIHEVSEAGAKLAIAQNVAEVLRPVFESIQSLPAGISVDSVSINPSLLSFGEEIVLPPLEEISEE